MLVRVSGDISFSGAPTTLPRALGRLRVVLDNAYAHASRELGLTGQQAELLCAAMRPAAVGDIARTLRCDRSNVSRLVDRAAKHGLVARRGGEEDGRVTVVELSPKGRQVAERFIEALQAQLGELLAEWPAERQEAAVEMLNQIADAVDTATAVAEPRRRARRLTA